MPEQTKIDPVFAGRLAKYAKDNNIVIYVTGNGKAGVPGTSWHENGEAIDVKNLSIKSLYGDWASTEEQKNLTKYGIFKTLTKGNGTAEGKREDWHIQPIETEGIGTKER